jgi:hypothetical protein
MAPYHLGAKMGIATSLVNDWKNDVERPKAWHIRPMVEILGKYNLPEHANTGCLTA